MFFTLLLCCWNICAEIPAPENEMILAVVKDRVCFAILYDEGTQKAMHSLYGGQPDESLHVQFPFSPMRFYHPVHLEKWKPLSICDEPFCLSINTD